MRRISTGGMTGGLLAGCLLNLALLASCGDDAAAGKGSVDVRVSGQGFAQSGWPAEQGGETVAFADGWEVRFDDIVLSVEAFRMAEGGDEVVAKDPVGFVADVHEGDFPLWSLDSVGARRWTDVGYRFSPPSAETEVLGKVSREVVEMMRDDGLSLYIAGRGIKEGRTVSFAFGIPGKTLVTNCLNGLDKTDGFIVGEGRTSEVEITLHMDHLFWDDHDAKEPRLLFGPMAFAAGDDDLVTLDELEAQRLTDMRDEEGEALVDEKGTPIVYVPREELRDNNLREYITDTALTLGHFNGEGHCQYEVSLAK